MIAASAQRLRSTYFFNEISAEIESCKQLDNKYKVFRSEDDFDITPNIIRSLYESDIVICDLSGIQPNPNVMYELGVRLSLTNKPVILIKQQFEKSKDPFDIAFFHRELYNPKQPKKIIKYIIKKIKKFELGEEEFVSPIYNALQASPSIIIHFKKRSAISILKGLNSGLQGTKENIRMVLKKKGFYDQKLKNIPGKGNFIFRPRQFPGLSAYLTNYPLTELFPERITNEVDIIILNFYMKYFCSDLYWQEGYCTNSSKFIEDAQNIFDIVEILIKAIPDCERPDIMANIQENISIICKNNS